MYNARHIQDLYRAIEQELQQANISLIVTRKRVKNINFRLKPSRLSVSVPYYATDKDIVIAISGRVEWAINQHAILLKRISSHVEPSQNPFQQASLGNLRLWGKKQPFMMGENERIHWYRQELQTVMPKLFNKWQPIVGKTAAEIRIKKMKTRWGSCNTKAKRVWLSVYLPAYPIECTEYVIVHELCHLHHPNHSAAFWDEVKRVMPEYKHWHNILAGKSGKLD